jgi:lysophospholipase L1-like esterase
MRNRKNRLNEPEPPVFALLLTICSLCLLLAPPPARALTTCFGDSITAGVGGSGGGYPPILSTLLAQNGRDPAVTNRGTPGDNTADGVAKIGAFLTVDNPDVVLILEGTNDVWVGISPAGTAFNLGSMIDQARALNVIPVVSTLTPDSSQSETFKNIPAINAEILAMAAGRGVTVADNYTATVADWPSLTADGLHPNDAGYGVLATTFALAMLPFAPAPEPEAPPEDDDSEEDDGSGTTPPTPTPPPSGGGGGGGGGCFIATAAYGTALEPEVVLLKRLRDRYLLPNGPGRAFVRCYYALSPSVAAVISESDALRCVVRSGLIPLIAASRVLLDGSPFEKAALAAAVCSLLAVLGCLSCRRLRRHPGSPRR